MSPRVRTPLLLGFGLLSSAALVGVLWASQSPATGPDLASTTAPHDAAPHHRGRALSVATPHANAALAPTSRFETDGAYLTDRVMVRPAPGISLDAIAAAVGGEVLRQPGRSGFGALAVPAGRQVGELLNELRRDGQVAQAAPQAIMRGAGAWRAFQEHLDLADHGFTTRWSSMDTSDVVVAVLDSGVAYESGTEDGQAHAGAESLADTVVVAPYDFVNDDAKAYDDHQHGTHIATIILGEGAVDGVAKGASLMPLKVLDENNEGTELDLVDAIWHAIDNGADIINMSLAFEGGYVPSPALREALQAASEADIVLVAAAGNSATDKPAWPAASNVVIGVGSTCYDGFLASYGNMSGAVEINAPGGCLDADYFGDGYPDGVVGETIYPGDPSRTGAWLWSGTSQAAALVSGSAAQMLASGATPDQILPALQDTALDNYWMTKRLENGQYGRGKGGGRIDLAAALDLVDADSVPEPETLYVSMIPYFAKVRNGAKPAAFVSVRDASGGLISGDVQIHTSMRGHRNKIGHCTAPKRDNNQCIVKHAKKDTTSTLASGVAYVMSVDAVTVNDVRHPIQAAIYAHDGLEVLAAALEENEDTAGLPLGVYFPPNATLANGDTASESYAWVDGGVGFASSPLGVLASPGFVANHTVSTVSVDLDGGVGFASSPLGGIGFASSPLGTMSLKRIDFGGVGFASSPLGFSGLSMLAMDGVGFASSPLGLDAFDIWAPGGSTGTFTTAHFTGNMVSLGSPVVAGTALDGMYLGGIVEGGGWTADGSGSYAIGQAMVGTGVVDAAAEVLGDASALGTDAL